MIENFVVVGLGFLNAVVLYPGLKKFYRHQVMLQEECTHDTFFDIEIDGKDAGRIEFELFGKAAPKTVNNFLGISSGKAKGGLNYSDTKFHRIHPDYLI